MTGDAGRRSSAHHAGAAEVFIERYADELGDDADTLRRAAALTGRWVRASTTGVRRAGARRLPARQPDVPGAGRRRRPRVDWQTLAIGAARPRPRLLPRHQPPRRRPARARSGARRRVRRRARGARRRRLPVRAVLRRLPARRAAGTDDHDDRLRPTRPPSARRAPTRCSSPWPPASSAALRDLAMFAPARVVASPQASSCSLSAASAPV